MKFASIAWRLALAALLGIMAYFAYQFGTHAATWAERVVNRQTDRVLATTRDAIHDSRKDVLREVAALRKDTMRQMDELRITADARLVDVARIADKQLSRTNDTVASVVTAFEPSLSHIESITAHADEASAILLARNGLPAQLLGVTAAAKVTLGETAQTMRTVRDTTPQIAANIQRATDESALTAEQSRIAMKNLAEATKPLPRWLRIPLAITGAIAPTAAGAFGAAAATGAFR